LGSRFSPVFEFVVENAVSGGCLDIVVSFYHEMEPGRCLPVNLKIIHDHARLQFTKMSKVVDG
jgi:hypothetical protein